MVDVCRVMINGPHPSPLPVYREREQKGDAVASFRPTTRVYRPTSGDGEVIIDADQVVNDVGKRVNDVNHVVSDVG